MPECLKSRARDDRGLTLIELLVSMIVFSIVIAAAYSGLLLILKQTKDTAGRADAVADARLAIAQLDRQIRSGNVLYDPSNEAALGYPMSMRVFTQTNAQEKCVQWQIAGGALRMRSWETTWQTGGTVSGWQTIARSIDNTTSSADVPFKLSGDTTPYSARVINVHLVLKSVDSQGRRMTVDTAISGRNTVYGYDAGVCSPIPPSS